MLGEERKVAAPKEKEADRPAPHRRAHYGSRSIMFDNTNEKPWVNIRPDSLINIRYCLFHSWGISPLGTTNCFGEEPALCMQPGRDSPTLASVVDVDTKYEELRAAEMRTRRLAESWVARISTPHFRDDDREHRPAADAQKGWCDSRAALGHRNELAD